MDSNVLMRILLRCLLVSAVATHAQEFYSYDSSGESFKVCAPIPGRFGGGATFDLELYPSRAGQFVDVPVAQGTTLGSGGPGPQEASIRNYYAASPEAIPGTASTNIYSSHPAAGADYCFNRTAGDAAGMYDMTADVFASNANLGNTTRARTSTFTQLAAGQSEAAARNMRAEIRPCDSDDAAEGWAGQPVGSCAADVITNYDYCWKAENVRVPAFGSLPAGSPFLFPTRNSSISSFNATHWAATQVLNDSLFGERPGQAETNHRGCVVCPFGRFGLRMRVDYHARMFQWPHAWPDFETEPFMHDPTTTPGAPPLENLTAACGEDRTDLDAWVTCGTSAGACVKCPSMLECAPDGSYPDRKRVQLKATPDLDGDANAAQVRELASWIVRQLPSAAGWEATCTGAREDVCSICVARGCEAERTPQVLTLRPPWTNAHASYEFLEMSRRAAEIDARKGLGEFVEPREGWKLDLHNGWGALRPDRDAAALADHFACFPCPAHTTCNFETQILSSDPGYTCEVAPNLIFAYDQFSYETYTESDGGEGYDHIPHPNNIPEAGHGTIVDACPEAGRCPGAPCSGGRVDRFFGALVSKTDGEAAMFYAQGWWANQTHKEISKPELKTRETAWNGVINDMRELRRGRLTNGYAPSLSCGTGVDTGPFCTECAVRPYAYAQTSTGRCFLCPDSGAIQARYTSVVFLGVGMLAAVFALLLLPLSDLSQKSLQIGIGNVQIFLITVSVPEIPWPRVFKVNLEFLSALNFKFPDVGGMDACLESHYYSNQVGLNMDSRAMGSEDVYFTAGSYEPDMSSKSFMMAPSFLDPMKALSILVVGVISLVLFCCCECVRRRKENGIEPAASARVKDSELESETASSEGEEEVSQASVSSSSVPSREFSSATSSSAASGSRVHGDSAEGVAAARLEAFMAVARQLNDKELDARYQNAKAAAKAAKRRSLPLNFLNRAYMALLLVWFGLVLNSFTCVHNPTSPEYATSASEPVPFGAPFYSGEWSGPVPDDYPQPHEYSEDAIKNAPYVQASNHRYVCGSFSGNLLLMCVLGPLLVAISLFVWCGLRRSVARHGADDLWTLYAYGDIYTPYRLDESFFEAVFVAHKLVVAIAGSVLAPRSAVAALMVMLAANLALLVAVIVRKPFFHRMLTVTQVVCTGLQCVIFVAGMALTGSPGGSRNDAVGAFLLTAAGIAQMLAIGVTIKYNKKNNPAYQVESVLYEKAIKAREEGGADESS